MKLSRRTFLQVGATTVGGLTLTASLPGTARAAGADGNTPWVFVRIEPGRPVVIGARGAEIGQGVKTSLPMLIAEELDVAWEQVRVEQLPFALVPADGEPGIAGKYGAQGAGGSTSIPDSWLELRQVGARLRHMLVTAAARRWRLDAAELSTAAGRVLDGHGNSLAYGELAAEAALLPVPDSDLPLKPAEQFRIIGKDTPVADCRDIVTGRAEYGIDSDLDGALTAVIARCPYFEGDVESVDDSAALAVPGVRQVVRIPAPDPARGLVENLAAGVAVLADDTWSAIKGREALRIEWRKSGWANDSTQAFAGLAYASLDGAGKVAREDGNVETARDAAKRVITADYFNPFLAHCTMEPQNALLDLHEDRALLIASLQSPGGASRMINAMTGVDRLAIDVRMPRSGGGFGRRLRNDFVAEAVHIARAAGRPVKLVWMREDDMAHDWFRPSGAHRLTATLDARNRLTSWSHHSAATDRRSKQPGYADAPQWLGCLDPDAFPAGCVENYRAQHTALDFGLARGWWRGPMPTYVAFPIQSFIDEVAAASGRDPLQFRLDLLGKPRELPYSEHGGPVFHTGRLAAVLQKAADAIGYGRSVPDGHGIGIAGHFVFGGYTAHAMEVSVADGLPVIHRCVCATDVGRVVNPLGVEAQMISGTIDGISTALALQITVKDGVIEQKNFPDYPVLRMAQAPDVEVHIVHTGFAPSGAGEMGIPTAAPALANAIFAATGQRIRRLPIAGQLT